MKNRKYVIYGLENDPSSIYCESLLNYLKEEVEIKKLDQDFTIEEFNDMGGLMFPRIYKIENDETTLIGTGYMSLYNYLKRS